jgi:predicted tellurium resistance membrane protein TerC
MEMLLDINIWSSFITLTILEIVLGFDNILFLTLMVNQLPGEKRPAARRFGLLGAMITRLILLFFIAWIARLTAPIFHLAWLNDHAVSWRDLILIGGGLFLIYKAVTEITASLEGDDGESLPKKRAVTMFGIIAQIALIDIIFSLDSVITAVGLAEHYFVMAAAIIVAIGVMLFAAEAIGDYLENHPSLKILALAFLVMVGAILVAEGLGHHMPKGYMYFAIIFALSVEMINLKMRKKMGCNPLILKQPYKDLNP